MPKPPPPIDDRTSDTVINATLPRAGNVKMIPVLVGAVIVLSAIFGSWYTIDQTERGVLLRNGLFVGVVEPGLHFKIPFFDSIKRIDMKTHTSRWDKINSYSADQQPADLTVSVTMHVLPEKVAEMYSRFSGDLNAAVNATVAPRVLQNTSVVIVLKVHGYDYVFDLVERKFLGEREWAALLVEQSDKYLIKTRDAPVPSDLKPETFDSMEATSYIEGARLLAFPQWYRYRNEIAKGRAVLKEMKEKEVYRADGGVNRDKFFDYHAILDYVLVLEGRKAGDPDEMRLPPR